MTEQEKLILDTHKQITLFDKFTNYGVYVDVGTVLLIKNEYFIRRLKCIEGSCEKCFFYKNFGEICNLLNCSGKCFEEIEFKQLKPVPTEIGKHKIRDKAEIFIRDEEKNDNRRENI